MNDAIEKEIFVNSFNALKEYYKQRNCILEFFNKNIKKINLEMYPASDSCVCALEDTIELIVNSMIKWKGKREEIKLFYTKVSIYLHSKSDSFIFKSTEIKNSEEIYDYILSNFS